MKKHIKNIYEKVEDVLVHVIIPSAGVGKRMKSYGCKSLLSIKDEKLIDIQIKNINKAFPNNEIILITGFDSDRLITNSPDDIIKIENERYYDNNVSKSISIGLRATKNNQHVVIVFGDVLFNHECLHNINIGQSCIIISDHMEDQEVGCNINGAGKLEYMMFDLPNKWGHIVYLTNKELLLFKKITLNKKVEKRFCFEIINEIISNGGKFVCIRDNNMKCMDIDTSKDLKKAQEFI